MTDSPQTVAGSTMKSFTQTLDVQKALAGKLFDSAPEGVFSPGPPLAEKDAAPVANSPDPNDRPENWKTTDMTPLPRNAREVYCQIVLRKVRHLPLSKTFFSPNRMRRSAGRIRLDRVYIDQTVQMATPATADLSPNFAPCEADAPRFKALEAAATHRHLVITGDPGGGKSTFLHYLTLHLAVQNSGLRIHGPKRLRGWPESEQDVLPVLVNLPDFSKSMMAVTGRPAPRHLWQFVLDELKSENLTGSARMLRMAFEQGKAMMLLDGLDEVPTARERERVRDAIQEFADRYPQCRLMVTCRTLTYEEPTTQLPDMPVARLLGFSEGLRNHFLHLWFKELSRQGEITSTGDAEALCHCLQEAIRSPHLSPLSANPLLLTLMALIHQNIDSLPISRAVFYETAVDMLLWRWDQIKTQGRELLPPLRWLYLDADCNCNDDDVKKIIMEMAFQGRDAQGGDGPAADVNEMRILRALARLHPEQSIDWADRMARTIQLRAGLFIHNEPETYTFSQSILQSYLAGGHLSTHPDFSRVSMRLLEQHTAWRDVILMAVNRMIYHEKDKDRPLALAAELCSARDPMGDALWRQTHLAGEILLELGQKHIQESALARDLQERIHSRTLALVQGDHLKPDDRNGGMDLLHQLGFKAGDAKSPRVKITEDPLLRFMKIPAGEFLMGSDPKKDPKAGKEEQPLHKVNLSLYYIGKHPTTVGQFRTFVSETGYQPQGSWDACAERDDLPVVSVSWYDAMAYCRWLNETLKPVSQILRERDWVVRLPTEAEWEKAARGLDGRIFPWGKAPDPRIANYEKSGMGSVKPVGSFPKGISPFKCHDMAGNVWEWTHSLWGKSYDQPTFRYPYDPTDGREDASAGTDINRVVRGGSFSDDDWAIRCAFRIAYVADSGLRELGFRVAIGPRLNPEA